MPSLCGYFQTCLVAQTQIRPPRVISVSAHVRPTDPDSSHCGNCGKFSSACVTSHVQPDITSFVQPTCSFCSVAANYGATSHWDIIIAAVSVLLLTWLVTYTVRASQSTSLATQLSPPVDNAVRPEVSIVRRYGPPETTCYRWLMVWLWRSPQVMITGSMITCVSTVRNSRWCVHKGYWSQEY
jgi:hypothetical protein